MAERHTHTSDEIGKRNGSIGPHSRTTLAVVIAVAVFVFGVGIWVKGQSAKDDEHDRALDGILRALEEKVDRRDISSWVRELQRDPARIPEWPPR